MRERERKRKEKESERKRDTALKVASHSLLVISLYMIVIFTVKQNIQQSTKLIANTTSQLIV